MNQKLFLLTCGIFLLFNVYAQQDPLYSQYANSQLNINPAYAGFHNNFEVVISSRLQWTGIEGAPKTFSLSSHTSLPGNKLGVGLVAYNDKLGVTRSSGGFFIVSYKTAITKNIQLSFGLQGGGVSYDFDYSIINQEEEDPELVSHSVSSGNIGAGLVVSSKRFFLGLAVPQLMERDFDVAVENQPFYNRHYYAYAGYLLTINCFLRFKPSVMVKYLPNAPLSIDYNSSVLINDKIWAGVSLRNLNAFVINGAYQISNNMRLGYSYDLAMNELVKYTTGSHELNFLVNLALLNNHMIIPRYF